MIAGTLSFRMRLVLFAHPFSTLFTGRELEGNIIQKRKGFFFLSFWLYKEEHSVGPVIRFDGPRGFSKISFPVELDSQIR